MSYKVKDYYGNLIAQFEELDDLNLYISSSQTTSSFGIDDSPLNYFTYDTTLHSDLSSSISLDENTTSIEYDLSLVRVIYSPFDDEELE